MAGYEIRNLSKDSFNTDFKHDPASDRGTFIGKTATVSYKFIVVAQEPSRISFTLRAQQTDYVSNINNLAEHGKAKATREVQVGYAEQNREWHLGMRSLICAF